MDVLSIAWGLANMVPGVLKWLGHENAGQSAEKIVQLAQKVSGEVDAETALQSIRANPSLALQLQQELDDHQLELARLSQGLTLAAVKADVDSAQAINTTMQQELAAEHWPSYSWRPFVGFCFGVALLLSVLVVAGAYIAVMFDAEKANILHEIPAFLTSMSVLLAVPMPVLGIASWFRGKMQADPSIPTINRG